MPRATLRRAGFAVLAAAVIFLAVPAFPALGSLPASDPELDLVRTIMTSPFVGTSVSVKDNEGGTFVASDNSVWMVDDNGRSVFEVDRTTGAFKSSIGRAALESAPRFGGGQVAGSSRVADLESMAYDAANDALYVFSGPCCTSSVLPTAFRLLRDGGGIFQVDSYQPLPSGSDFTAAAWTSADGKVYVGKGNALRTYDYLTNAVGPSFSVPGLRGILGLGFSDDGADLIVVTNAEHLVRVNWASRTIMPGWDLDLTGFGVRDSRGVELVDDQFFVHDGYDQRPAGDPLRHAIFVFGVTGEPGGAPVASFAASPTSGAVPLQVSFTDTSSGGPTAWQWDFGDGSTSQTQHPTHIYAAPGVYIVTLTVSNASGQSTATAQIAAVEAGEIVGNPGFEVNTDGWGTSGSVSGVTLARVPGGHSGGWSARLANGGSTSGKCMLNDSPNWVRTTVAGTYAAAVWVRADAAGATLRLRFREYQGGSLVGSPQVILHTLTTTWQLVTVSRTVQAPGSTLDLSAFVSNAPTGTCFYADDVSIAVS
jgi:PKD repeat protein